MFSVCWTLYSVVLQPRLLQIIIYTFFTKKKLLLLYARLIFFDEHDSFLIDTISFSTLIGEKTLANVYLKDREFLFNYFD